MVLVFTKEWYLLEGRWLLGWVLVPSWLAWNAVECSNKKFTTTPFWNRTSCRHAQGVCVCHHKARLTEEPIKINEIDRVNILRDGTDTKEKQRFGRWLSPRCSRFGIWIGDASSASSAVDRSVFFAKQIEGRLEPLPLGLPSVITNYAHNCGSPTVSYGGALAYTLKLQ